MLLVCVIVFAVYSFSNRRNESREIQAIDVLFKGEDYHFVTSEDIRNLVKKNISNSSEISRSIVDLKNLEDELLENELIRNAEVYISLDGVLSVDVWQKKAYARLFSEGKSYYIDEEGGLMPISINFSQRALVVQGRVTKENKVELLDLLKLIDADEFLRMDLTSIVIEEDGTLVMRSRSNDYKILFGTFDEKKRKLNNYKAFVNYSTEVENKLDSYKSINLRFTQQVVCSK